MSEKLLRPGEVCRRLGISYPTLRRWIESGHVKAIRTIGGKYRVPESEVMRILELRAKETRAAVYARVSSHNQRESLEMQVRHLLEYCASKGYRVVEVLTDIASGLRTDRRGLIKLFELVTSKQVEVVVVTYRDKLTKYGYEYLEYFFNQYGARIEAVFGEEPRDARLELIEDLVEIITYFASRLYGMRSYKKKKLVEGFKKLIKEVEESGENNSN